MERKPIKRNENIAALSREHHDGLLFCWKLRQGIKTGIAPYRMRRYAAFFWEEHLKAHFKEEETLLFQPLSHPMVDRALAEHREIKSRIDIISHGTADTPEPYAGLADLVDRHIRFEERELFPLLEATLSPEQLERIGEALAAHEAAHTPVRYGDEFWTEGK